MRGWGLLFPIQPLATRLALFRLIRCILGVAGNEDHKHQHATGTAKEAGEESGHGRGSGFRGCRTGNPLTQECVAEVAHTFLEFAVSPAVTICGRARLRLSQLHF